jgi:hypothetical protein
MLSDCIFTIAALLLCLLPGFLQVTTLGSRYGALFGVGAPLLLSVPPPRFSTWGQYVRYGHAEVFTGKQAAGSRGHGCGV